MRDLRECLGAEEKGAYIVVQRPCPDRLLEEGDREQHQCGYGQ